VARGLRITHLMFVDDIVLFGNGNLSEWKVFKQVLDLFFQATGMAFNPQKSTFLEASWNDAELALLREFFPFVVKPLDDGFKYLGCYLKTKLLH
jgi:hypothetical protein